MRLRQRNLVKYKLKKRATLYDDDGTSYEGYEDAGTVKAKARPAGGKVAVEMYGEKLKYMLTMRTNDMSTSINESDGFCVYSTDEPDYKVVAIKTFTDHKIIDLEKV